MMQQKGYEALHICGLDECGCVTATALGAAKRGFRAEIIRNGTVSVFPESKIEKAHKKLEKPASRSSASHKV